ALRAATAGAGRREAGSSSAAAAAGLAVRGGGGGSTVAGHQPVGERRQQLVWAPGRPPRQGAAGRGGRTPSRVGPRTVRSSSPSPGAAGAGRGPAPGRTRSVFFSREPPPTQGLSTMGYALIWTESLAVALVLVALIAACAARWPPLWRWGVSILVSLLLLAP